MNVLLLTTTSASKVQKICVRSLACVTSDKRSRYIVRGMKSVKSERDLADWYIDLIVLLDTGRWVFMNKAVGVS